VTTTLPGPPQPSGVAAAPEARRGIVTALASRPQDLTGTARYAIRTSAGDPGRSSLVSSVEGLADFGQQRYSAELVTFDPADGSRRGSRRYFVVGDVIFEDLPQGWMPGTKPPGEIGSPLPLPPLLGWYHEGGAPAYAPDPAARRTLVEGLVSGIEDLGREVLRGTGTNRYRVHLDAVAAQGKVPRLLLDEMDRWGESPGRGYLDVWLEGDRLRQFTSVTKPYEEAWVRVEQEYWDHGEVEPLDVPPGLPARPPR
jgi:hypothetical protein